jgi:lipopolysaccharide/colanic/teichoic acid biosynthesis glycosyltransferase
MKNISGVKKILVTGATGFLGSQLTVGLENHNVDLILAGRNEYKLKQAYPKHLVISYDNLDSYSEKIDVVVHLAVLNNNSKGKQAEFQNANVDLFKKILSFCRKNNVSKVINLSSFHIYGDKLDPYSTTKREAHRLAKEHHSTHIINIICPFIYSTPFQGKLSLFNKLPVLIKRPSFTVVSALKSLIHIDVVICEIIKQLSNHNSEKDILLADDKDSNIVYFIFKKIVNYGLSISALSILMIPMVFIWLLVKMTSKGPGIFIQNRIGLKGKQFKLYKFRTMKVDTKNMGTHFASSSDITKLGSLLRRTKLDELPQLFNILLGDMELIGPRPGLPEQQDLTDFRRKKNIYDVVPGITGYSQVNQVDMSAPQTLAEWDSRYIKLRSISFDVSILIQTFLGKGGGDKVKKSISTK